MISALHPVITELEVLLVSFISLTRKGFSVIGGHSIKGLDPALASVSTTGLHSTLSFRSSVLGPGIRKDGKETTTPDRCPRDAILANAYCPTTSFRSKRSSPISSFTSAEYERPGGGKGSLFWEASPSTYPLIGKSWDLLPTGRDRTANLWAPFCHIYSLLVKSAKRAFTGEIATSSTPLLLPVLNQSLYAKAKVVTMRHACRKRALVGEPVGRGDAPPNSHQKSPEHKRNLELRIETKRTTSILGAEVYEEWLFGPFRPVVRTSSFHVEDTGSIPVRDGYSFPAAFS
ncbi:hypothetical protein L195_g015665 [Trifolium pratense]|uniref:Uncharacterized protein n=2 Tax=Trifolium pratense TaxID=57577 RepID=A0A2K3MNZ1_TRIPR|nr:hypothetical protein L195_g015665 [Trifolium pratense]